MKHLALPDCRIRRLPFYLAMEEWAAKSLPAGEYFFSWRVNPTVICGRNQNMEAEVDMAYCREHGIDVVRRKSGGGCVYADNENLMFSYIAPGDEVTATFSHYTTMIAEMLRSLGLDAVATGRNDIVVSGKKVSGNAFYHLPGRSIVHGTMLYDFDPVTISRVLTPSRAKMESKGVQSVPMRVTGLKTEGIGMTRDEFLKHTIDSLTSGEITVSPDQIAEIEAIEKSYYEPSFLKGKHGASVSADIIQRQKRFEGLGEFSVSLRLDKDGAISALGISGDFFILKDPHENICMPLIGVPYRPDSLASAIDRIDICSIVSGMSPDQLLSLIIDLP